jgi:adenylate cyclase
MDGLSQDEVADRAGVGAKLVAELVAKGFLTPDAHGRLSLADVRRIGIIQALQNAGIPMDALERGVGAGIVPLAFLGDEEYERLPLLSPETFAEASARTGVPLTLALVIRDSLGLGSASPMDRLRDDEQPILRFVATQVRLGFSPTSIERLLRATGESLRKIAESEAEWWRAEVLEPSLSGGSAGVNLANRTAARELVADAEASLFSMYRAMQSLTWTANIIGATAGLLAQAGLYTLEQRPPAICFLDITGYTRLTQERGDREAAALADDLNRLVKRTSVQYGGRPVKWLGDGVMFHFPDPGQGVLAAIDMAEGVVGAGLPPAHVGLHCGPVVLRDGDYFGQTVNVAARIADYARRGEVLVSQAIVDAGAAPGVAFDDLGDVELKGVAGVVRLSAARRARRST